MTPVSETFVFDTGPLRHFALAGWLGVLKYLTQDNYVVIPESVEAELLEQRHSHASLEQVLNADWIAVDHGDDIQYLAEFARYEKRLVAGGRNRGECGVLALGRCYGYTMIVDDRVPRKIADDEKLRARGTLALLCEAIREGQLTVSMVESLADDLLTGYLSLTIQTGWIPHLGSRAGADRLTGRGLRCAGRFSSAHIPHRRPIRGRRHIGMAVGNAVSSGAGSPRMLRATASPSSGPSVSPPAP